MSLPGPVRDMLKMVLVEVLKTSPRERKKAAVQQMWLRMEAAQRLAEKFRLPVAKWWLTIIEEVEASDDPLEVLRRHLGGEVPEARRQKEKAPEPPNPRLTAAEVEKKLALFDKVVLDVLRDPEGVEKAIFKKVKFFEAFYRWAKSTLLRGGDLPEGVGAKLRAAFEVAYYCRPGGLMYAVMEAAEQKKPLPPEHPATYAVKNYVKTWLT